LLLDLREYPGTQSCYAFGDAHHLLLKEGAEKTHLLDYLHKKGYADIEMELIEPTIEDCFMQFG